MKLLLDEVTEDGNGTAVDFEPSLYNQYGKGAVVAFGTWDTATVTLQFSPDGGTTYYTLGTDTTFTDDGWSNFEINGKVKLRGNVSTAGASTSVSLGLL